MSLPSSGQISIGNVIREALSGDGHLGTTTPTSTQVNLGLSSLKRLTNLSNNSDSVLTQYYIAPWNTRPNDSAPYSLSEFRGKRRDGIGGA